MKIGIYGGTFNPPHLGHLAAIQAAVSYLKLDRLLLIPAAIPPHKALPDDTPAPEHRLEMTRRLADWSGMPQTVRVSTLELDRGGASYTADTLREISQEYPDADLWLLMGTDMFLTLHLWREPAEILKQAKICAFGRTEQDGEALFAPQREHLRKTFGAEMVTMTIPGLVDISSTRLRELLAQGEGQEYLPPSVYGYILLHGLYGTNADIRRLDADQLRVCSWAIMNGVKRVPHVQGVEEEIVRLARRWGADEDQARRAGILHDCTKYWRLEQHLALCEQYQVELDELELQAVKLLHSKTGACMARHVFGETDQVYEAIFWHTTGKADMALLDKLLYMADYIEPNRTFDGVDEMRRLAYEDLDAALLMGLEMTAEDMAQRGNPLHTNTAQAIAWLRGRRGV